MESLEWVNKGISSYRNSEYKWVRELTSEFEIYFDKNFREYFGDLKFKEPEIRGIFFYSLYTLRNIIHSYEYYVGDIQDYFTIPLLSQPHPGTKKDLPLNKEKAERLFIMVTMPFRIFERNSSKHLQNFLKEMIVTQKLDQKKRSLETELAKLEGKYETSENYFNKLAEDMQKDRRESIDRMPLTYIDACERYTTDKPTLTQLAYISGVPEEVWKKALANPIFLLYLLEKLKEKWKQAKEKEEFWRGAYNVIDVKYLEVTKRLKFKTSQLSAERDYDKSEGGSKQGKIKAEGIKADKAIGTPQKDEIKKCEICGDETKFGNLCKDCNEAFKVKKSDKLQTKTKIEIEKAEQIKNTIEKFTKKKDGNLIEIENQTANKGQ